MGQVMIPLPGVGSNSFIHPSFCFLYRRCVGSLQSFIDYRVVIRSPSVRLDLPAFLKQRKQARKCCPEATFFPVWLRVGRLSVKASLILRIPFIWLPVHGSPPALPSTLPRVRGYLAKFKSSPLFVSSRESLFFKN